MSNRNLGDESPEEMRRKIFLGTGIAVVAIVLLYFAFSVIVPRVLRAVRGEPEYAGYPASHWTETLAGKNPNMKWQDAANGLRQGGAKAVPVLIQVLKSDDVSVRQRAAKLLSQLRSPDAVAALTVAQRDRDNAVRCWSAFALFVTAPEAGTASIPSVLEATQISGEGIPEEIEKSMPQYPADKRAAGLIEGIASPHTDVRFLAVKYLTAMGPEAKPAVPALIGLLQDRVTEERGHRLADQAAEALQRIGPDARAQAVQHYLKQLRDTSADRAAAAFALGRLRGDAQAAVPLLKKLAQDKDAKLAEAAQNALDAIPKQ